MNFLSLSKCYLFTEQSHVLFNVIHNQSGRWMHFSSGNTSNPTKRNIKYVSRTIDDDDPNELTGSSVISFVWEKLLAIRRSCDWVKTLFWYFKKSVSNQKLILLISNWNSFKANDQPRLPMNEIRTNSMRWTSKLDNYQLRLSFRLSICLAIWNHSLVTFSLAQLHSIIAIIEHFVLKTKTMNKEKSCPWESFVVALISFNVRHAQFLHFDCVGVSWTTTVNLGSCGGCVESIDGSNFQKEMDFGRLPFLSKWENSNSNRTNSQNDHQAINAKIAVFNRTINSL